MVLTVIFGTWAGDTMAYFTGKCFGSTPMAPRLSPKKTWEGFVGGLIGTVLLVVLHRAVHRARPAEVAAARCDDRVSGTHRRPLREPRQARRQIKDAGRFFPGHGGVLDRFDALLWTSVACYFVLTAGFGF